MFGAKGGVDGIGQRTVDGGMSMSCCVRMLFGVMQRVRDDGRRSLDGDDDETEMNVE